MAQIGYSYLVTHVVTLDYCEGDCKPGPVTMFATEDGTLFLDEPTMLAELGASGWELFLIREHDTGARHYFRRPRA